MKLGKLLPVWRGLTAVMVVLLVLSVVGYTIADKWRSTLDNVLGTESYISSTEEGGKYSPDYDTPEKMLAAAREISVREGEEGFVLMKNDNNALPLSSENKTIALFGAAAYVPYMQGKGDLKAGNDNNVDLVAALENAGYEIEPTLQAIYEDKDNGILADFTETNRFGNVIITYNNAYLSSPGDMVAYQVREVPPEKYSEFGASANWAETVSQNADVAICVFARGAGESNTYLPGVYKDYAGNERQGDPLGLSVDELAVIDAAKEACDTVIVLINSGNSMELGEIAEGGAHEVDAIGYIGVLNDYQAEGIVNVLTGKANATGAMATTYVYNNESAPALVNFGGDAYGDQDIVTSSDDPRYPGKTIYASGSSDGFGSGSSQYAVNGYIVEAEGIYVGYNYYETRYYDSIVNSAFKANSTAGSSTGEAWNYADEVVYTFGHGLSYLDYTQNIRSVQVSNTANGMITAVIDVKNNSDKDGLFLAQLYVQTPYTEYDRDNLVEKSAIMFLNSAKVEVNAGATESVTITVPTKYLASYDYKTAKTYVMDAGDYVFTAAAGAHEAVNNVLYAQGYDSEDGVDVTAAAGRTAKWTLGSLDSETFSVSHDVEVTNQMDNLDLNYWLPGTVTYLSRQDWEGTWPVNYNEEAVEIGDSARSEEWLKELRGQQYLITETEEKVENIDGADLGVKFSSEDIGYEQLADINNEFWDTLVKQISVNEAVGAVIHGGGQSDVLEYVDNPVVTQHEGVNGFVGSEKSTDESTDYKYNINSQTLLASSFNPELAYEWGKVMGNAGLRLKFYSVWGTGLTQIRTPYNGRNYEYVSEDAMLTNRIGYGIAAGSLEKGVFVGPKHIGMNDQEHNRSGISVYATEQKLREGDLRGFEGFLNDAGGQAVMVAFNRLGAINASHHVGVFMGIVRGEWGFKGLISTDMMNNKYYFNPEGCIMAGITQMADFGGNNSTLGGAGGQDATWSYLSVDVVKNDATLCAMARECMKYQLYAFANSAILNITTTPVTPWWETALITGIVATAVLSAAAVVLWVFASVVNKKEEE